MVKAVGFDPAIREFESRLPSCMFIGEMKRRFSSLLFFAVSVKLSYISFLLNFVLSFTSTLRES